MIQKGINKLLQGRTTFIIEYRLSTIQSADLIMVIEDGKISESGTYDELMKNKNLYYKLFTAQLKFFASIKNETKVV